MAELSIEQQRAIAVANARRRAAEARGRERPWEANEPPAGSAMVAGEPDGSAARGFGEVVGKAGRFVDDTVRSLARGVPVFGAMADRADPQPELDAAFAENHPVLANALPVVGGIASMIPVAMTGPGAAALGLRGSLPVRIGAGGLSGAGIGAGDAAIRGGDSEDVRRAARWTGAIGGALPVAGRVIGGAVRAGARTLSPSASGAREVSRALQRDRTTPEQLAARGPGAMAMDAGENTIAQAGRVAAAGGKGQAIVRDAVEGRAARVDQMIDELDAAAAPRFRDALHAAKPVDTSPVMLALETAQVPRGGPIARWLNHFQRRLTDKDGLPLYDAEQLHLVQSDMWRTVRKLGKSANGEDRLAADAINNLRQGLIDRIDEAAGGAYRPAQRWYAGEIERIVGMGADGPVVQAVERGLKQAAKAESKGLDVRRVTGMGLEAGIPTATYFLGGGLGGAAAAGAAIGARRGAAAIGRARDRTRAASAAKLLATPAEQLSEALAQGMRGPQLSPELQALVRVLAPSANASVTPRLSGR